MKNIVIFETAKRLKEAGFPQPEFEFGQFWYAPNGNLCVMSGDGIYSGEARVMLKNGNTMFIKTYDIVFAPTATDILEHLPGYALKIQKSVWCVFNPEYIYAVKSTDDVQMYFQHKNPAEAAAESWIKINRP